MQTSCCRLCICNNLLYTILNRMEVFIIVDILKYCLSKEGAYEDHPFGPEPIVVKVGSKMFALISKKSNTSGVSPNSFS